jgi:hypothetical protein
VSKRFDFQTQLTAILEQLNNGAFDTDTVDPTPYDHWLNDQLHGQADKSWLGGNSLYASVIFCRFLGAELNKIMPATHPHQLGFAATQGGVQSLRQAFQLLTDRQAGKMGEPSKAFGRLYRVLNSDLIDETALDPFSDIFRDFIVDTWPFPAGEVILGKPLPQRHLHSVYSACQETGLDRKTLTRVLTHIGALQDQDDRSDNRKVFDARSHADLLDELRSLVPFKDLQDAMGISKRALGNLIDDGLIRPHIEIPGVLCRWSKADGIRLVSDLADRAAPISVDAEGWETISDARKRRQVKFGKLIEAVQSGELSLGSREGFNGFDAFCLKIEEVTKWSRKHAPNSSASEGVRGVCSVAEFGRVIGLRAWIYTRFIEAGQSPSTLSPHP